MARVQRSILHGQPRKEARERFIEGIERAVEEHGRHFQPVAWSEDRTKAELRGKGFALDLSVDDEFVHVDGQIPFFLKFLEGPVLKFVEETFRARGAGES